MFLRDLIRWLGDFMNTSEFQREVLSFLGENTKTLAMQVLPEKVRLKFCLIRRNIASYW
jgi:hypothetical protein